MRASLLIRRRSGSAERRGVVLVFFALLFFALFGLFAVVVDWGFVRTTQIQMQTSADVAALAGLSARDAVIGDPAASDLQRRQAAALFAASVFDEDLDRGTPPSQFQLGAGPVLSNGVVSSSQPAGGVLQAEAPWLPGLQTNVDQNLASGDLVAGAYLPVDPLDPGNVAWHSEANDYGRLDFIPADPSLAPSSRAFLARLRRTREDAPLDRVPGVSSAGPALPYLFGLGSAALVPENPELYDPRRDGITVRAVSIAEAMPVTMAGIARPGLTGLAPLAADANTGAPRWLTILLDQNWRAVPTNSSLVLEVNASGIVDGGATGVSGLAALGEARVGAAVSPGALQIASGSPPAELAGLVYASLHAPFESNPLPIIRGFVALSVDSASVEPGPVLRLTVTKLGATVAPRNASALRSLAVNPSIEPTDGGLLAAVLAR